MGLFDSILDSVGGEVTDMFGDDAGDMLDKARGFLGGDSNGESGDGDSGSGGGWGDRLSGLFGGGSDDGGSDSGSDGDSGGGGWGGMLGRIVDSVSGDGGGDGGGLFGGVIDKVKSYVPDDLRDAADSLFNGDGGGLSSWAGKIVDTASDVMPDGWQSVATAAVGHSFGEGGFDGLADRAVNTLRGLDTDDLVRAAEKATGVDFDDLTPNAATTPTPNTAPAATHDDFGDNLVTQPSVVDENDSFDQPQTVDAGGARDDFDDPTFDDATPAPSQASADVDQPDVNVAPQPMDDFDTAIHEADQIEDSFDSMFEGLE